MCADPASATLVSLNDTLQSQVILTRWPSGRRQLPPSHMDEDDGDGVAKSCQVPTQSPMLFALVACFFLLGTSSGFTRGPLEYQSR
jgi:hypothetical protein